MNEHLAFIRAAVLAVVATASTAAVADTITETEPNDSVTSAQVLPSTGSDVVVSGFIGTLQGSANDVDYYAFHANAGDVVTIDIDNGIGGAQSIDLVLALFDPQNNYAILREVDDAATLDPGSISTWDPRIDNFVVGATGTYVIGVSSTDRPFVDGGGVQNADTFGGNGDYTLTVSGVSAAALPVKQVAVKVRPDHHRLMPLEHEPHGRIAVAVLSSSSFDAMQIDESSLTFGKTGDEKSLSYCEPKKRDVNHDGLPDKVCRFNVKAAAFQTGDLEGIVKGKTKNGGCFEGHGRLKVPHRKHHHRHDG